MGVERASYVEKGLAPDEVRRNFGVIVSIKSAPLVITKSSQGN